MVLFSRWWCGGKHKERRRHAMASWYEVDKAIDKAIDQLTGESRKMVAEEER